MAVFCQALRRSLACNSSELAFKGAGESQSLIQSTQSGIGGGFKYCRQSDENCGTRPLKRNMHKGVKPLAWPVLFLFAAPCLSPAALPLPLGASFLFAESLQDPFLFSAPSPSQEPWLLFQHFPTAISSRSVGNFKPCALQ